jgi:hypothetical protein
MFAATKVHHARSLMSATTFPSLRRKISSFIRKSEARLLALRFFAYCIQRKALKPRPEGLAVWPANLKLDLGPELKLTLKFCRGVNPPVSRSILTEIGFSRE